MFQFDNFVIYGAGNMGRCVYRILKEHGFIPVAFIDKYKQGDIDKIPIYSLNTSPNELKQSSILLAINRANPPALIEEICQNGWNRSDVFNFVEFFRLAENVTFLPPYFWIGPSMTNEQRPLAMRARALLRDEKSIELFDAMVEVRETGVYSPVLLNPQLNQYCFEKILNFSPFHFVDMGAYVGDTIQTMVNFGIQFHSIYCFEPDNQNLLYLSQRIKDLKLTCPVSIFPIGAYKEFNKCHFIDGEGEVSCLSESGNCFIQTGALDDILINHPISYIKMDIEGAELDALKGAKSIITKSETPPVLAISVYHRPEHLWEIPLWIQSVCPKYDYYLRNYEYNCFDTILYAIPK